ncbi:MAG: hypothetical protein ACREND_08255 [Gemmatimonadaceae bacterium]
MLTSYQGVAAVVIVLSQPSAQHPFVDSALVRRDGLAPIWEVQHSGTKRTRYDYDGAIVRRTVTEPDSAATRSTVTYPFRVFNFNELDEVIRSVPLRNGYHAIVPLYSEGDNALETDTIDVGGQDGAGVWNVRFADKVIIGHYGIDGATRRITRYDLNRHADRAHFHYVFTLGEAAGSHAAVRSGVQLPASAESATARPATDTRRATASRPARAAVRRAKQLEISSALARLEHGDDVRLR